MATDAQYGNWLPACEPETSSTELQARGIYAFVQPTAPPANSPNTLDSDNVYDDTSFVTPKALQSQTEYSFVKKTEVMDNGEAPPISKTTERKDERNLHVIILYVLVAVCFVIWASLLSLFLLKFSAISEELHNLNVNNSETLMRVKSYEDYIEKMHALLVIPARDNYSKLQEISASICDNGISSVFTSCPSGWEKEENNCYYFSEGQKNWTDALWDCVHRKAHMVSIWTDEEQGFLKERHNKLIRWLGMTDLQNEGKWRWEEGNQLVSTAFWKFGEPQKGTNKSCGIMHPSGEWGSAACSDSYHWICKKTLIC